MQTCYLTDVLGRSPSSSLPVRSGPRRPWRVRIERDLGGCSRRRREKRHASGRQERVDPRTGLLFTWSIALGIRVILPRHLGPSLFGTLQFADAFASTFFVLVSLGMETYIRKEVAVRPEHASDFYAVRSSCAPSSRSG